MISFIYTSRQKEHGIDLLLKMLTDNQFDVKWAWSRQSKIVCINNSRITKSTLVMLLHTSGSMSWPFIGTWWQRRRCHITVTTLENWKKMPLRKRKSKCSNRNWPKWVATSNWTHLYYHEHNFHMNNSSLLILNRLQRHFDDAIRNINRKSNVMECEEAVVRAFFTSALQCSLRDMKT